MVSLGCGAGAQIEGDKQGTTAFGELLCIGLLSLPVLFFLSPPPRFLPSLSAPTSSLFLHSFIHLVVYLIICLLSCFPIHPSSHPIFHSFSDFLDFCSILYVFFQSFDCSSTLVFSLQFVGLFLH